jgi:hypothetical protein
MLFAIAILFTLRLSRYFIIAADTPLIRYFRFSSDLIIDSHYYFQMPHTPLLMPLLLPAI